jgi:hypothetical protein
MAEVIVLFILLLVTGGAALWFNRRLYRANLALKALVERYEPFYQAAALGKKPEQIQDVSDNGKKLLETIVALLKEQAGELAELKTSLNPETPAPASETPATPPSPVKSVTNKKRTSKRGVK